MKLFLLLGSLAFSWVAHASIVSFDPADISGYGTQAQSGSFTIFDVGSETNVGLSLEGNYWVDIDLSTLPSLDNAILTFEFMTDDLGELHGIGFDSDDTLINSGGGFAPFFQLAGTQTLGNQDYRVSTGLDTWQTFVIDLSAFDFTQYDRIIFAADMDGGDKSTSSSFRNLTISSSSAVDVSAPSTFGLLSLFVFGLVYRARKAA